MSSVTLTHHIPVPETGPICTTEPFQADREGRDRQDRGHAEEGDLTKGRKQKM